MSMVTATVDPRAWVLEVTGDWPASAAAFSGGGGTGPHPDFPLDPDGTPKVVLTVTSPGFTRAGGEAVPTTWTRTVVATKPLRQAWPGSTSSARNLDERDNGDGTRTVWLALSEPIYAGETVTAVLAAGWRVGEPASGGPVEIANGSTRTHPLPIARWAQPQMMEVRGTSTARVDMIIASHFPRHFGATANQAVAAVRFDVTDTTTTKSQWVTADSVSPLFGDNLLCWGSVLDLSGLNPGRLQVAATIYPWIGTPRVIGSAPMPTNILDVWTVQPDIRMSLFYDPAGFFEKRFVYVNAQTGSSTASAVTVGTSLAAAKAGTAASTVSVALQAMYLANYTRPAANDYGSAARAAPNWEVVLAPGLQSVGTTTVTSGLTTSPGHMIVRGDPDDPNPRQNCRLRSGSTTVALRALQFCLRDLQLELGNVNFSMQSVWIDRCTVVRRQDFASVSYFFGAAPTAPRSNFVATDFRWVDYEAPRGGFIRPLLLRNGAVRRSNGLPTSGRVFINLTTERPAIPTGYSASANSEFEFWTATGSAASDHMAWGIRALGNNGRALEVAPAFTDANGFQVVERMAVVNCLFERANVDTDYKFVQIGENFNNRMVDCVWEGNTFVGQRISWHNDPTNPSSNLRHLGNCVRQNYFDRNSSKNDLFPTESSNRTGGWELNYGVHWTGNVIGQRGGLLTAQFAFDYVGRASVNPSPGGAAGSVSVAQFLDDQCNWGPNATPLGVNGVGAGGGDYRPGAGSVLLGRATVANTNLDLNGVVRGSGGFASGSVEAEPTAGGLLQPAAVAHAVDNAPPLLRVAPTAGPAAARHDVAGAGTAVHFAPAAGDRVATARILTVRAEARDLGVSDG